MIFVNLRVVKLRFCFSFVDHAKSIEQECQWENEERAIPMPSALLCPTLAISKRMVRCV